MNQALKTGIIVVARMASSRLPGKSMMDIHGLPSLGWLVERARASSYRDSITIATTDHPSDDPIAAFAAERGVGCFRGSTEDVLGRVHGAAHSAGLDIVIHVTGDCPLLDPELMDTAVAYFLEHELDYVILDSERYPPGLDVEVFRIAALDEVERDYHDPWIREHVTEPLYTTPDRWKAGIVPCPSLLNRPQYRLTIDTREDWEMVKAVTGALGPSNRLVSAPEIVELLDRRPDLRAINSTILQTKYRAAVIGLGRIGSLYDREPSPAGSVNTHAGAYVRHGRTHLAGGADPDPAARQKFREDRRIGAVYADASAMLADLKPDVVSVASSHAFHVEHVIAAADAGVRAIFCEKPFALDFDEGRRAVEMCRERGTILAVNHWMRWSPQFRAVREFIAGGGIGEVLAARLHYSKGALNSGSHAVDLVRFLFGEVARVIATERIELDTGDPNLGGVLRMKTGLPVHLTVSDYRRHFTFDLDIIGVSGRLFIHDEGIDYWRSAVQERAAGERSLVRAELPFAWGKGEPFLLAVDELVRLLDAGGGTPSCSGEDGLRAFEVIEALKRSWEAGIGIELSCEEKFRLRCKSMDTSHTVPATELN